MCAQYTRNEFIEQHGGIAEWDLAQLERRIDPEDGNAYTREEFIDAYGGTKEWQAAVLKRVQAEGSQTQIVENQQPSKITATPDSSPTFQQSQHMASSALYATEEQVRAALGAVPVFAAFVDHSGASPHG
eukprot:SAG31_NODE_6165_length_2141_cov_1.959354_4_plen_130_part_00